MSRLFWIPFLLPATLALGAPVFAPTGFPFQDESLHYTIDWPSGLNLGDAHLNAHKSATGWEFEMSVDAAIPGFAIADHLHSSTNTEGCSVQFERDTSHGKKKAHEQTDFDYHNGAAHRSTLVPGGGTSDQPISSCAHDALAFLYFARRELGQGRVPPQEDLYFGAAYLARLEYTGAQTIQSNGKPAVTDHVVVSLKGPASDFHFEIFFARDPARTPLSVRIPSSFGTISLELAR